MHICQTAFYNLAFSHTCIRHVPCWSYTFTFSLVFWLDVRLYQWVTTSLFFLQTRSYCLCLCLQECTFLLQLRFIISILSLIFKCHECEYYFTFFNSSILLLLPDYKHKLVLSCSFEAGLNVHHYYYFKPCLFASLSLQWVLMSHYANFIHEEEVISGTFVGFIVMNY